MKRPHDADLMRAVLTMGLPVTQALQPGKVGSFYYTGLVRINTTDTAVSAALGRIPSGYLVWRSQGPGVVQDGANHGSDWTGSTIVLKASISGMYGLLVG